MVIFTKSEGAYDEVHILLQSSVPYAYTRWPVSDLRGDICSHN